MGSVRMCGESTGGDSWILARFGSRGALTGIRTGLGSGMFSGRREWKGLVEWPRCISIMMSSGYWITLIRNESVSVKVVPQ
jgi:hypothetical protein